MNQYRGQRALDDIRSIKIETGLQKYAVSSVLWSQGDTRVLTAVTVEEGVPSFLRDSGKGWLTAEYALLPASTLTRSDREAARGKQTGRTVEIQRLIGRSLRQAVDLELLGEHTIKIDCEVIQADGGTRTAAISSAWLALALAAQKLRWNPKILKNKIAAISVGLVGGEASLDLEYAEDSKADVDMNVVMTGQGNFVEIQGTGENSDFSPAQLNELLAMAQKGIEQIFGIDEAFLKQNN
ncbi:MAG: ribonuclease PH [Bacillota bacterium]|nr:ribonuclease PH [Bacillota bacterium]